MTWVSTLRQHGGPIWLHNETGEYGGRVSSGTARKEGYIPLGSFIASLMLTVHDKMKLTNQKRYAHMDVAVALDFALKMLESPHE